MDLSNFETAIQFELWITPILDDNKLTTGYANFYTSNSDGEFNLIQNETLFQVKLRDKHQENALYLHLKRGCAYLSQIIQTANDGTGLLKIKFFNGTVIEMGDIEVGINEKIENTAKESGFRFKKVEELSQLLTEKCLIKAGDTGDEYYFLMMTGAAAEKDFVDENAEQEEAEHNTVGGFSIIGERLKIPVEKGLIEKDKEIFFANKLINKTERYPDGALRLAKGKLKFLPYSETERIRSLAAGSMARILQDKGSYLKQWDEYGAVEGELLLARAKAVGKIEYTQTEQTAKGVKFFIKGSIPSELTDDDSLEITTEEPSYLKNTDLSWNEYSAELELEFKTKTKEFNNDKTEVISAKIVKIESSSIELALESLPTEDHFLVLSINGDTTQVKRRMTARQLICEGRSANPLLGLLIEENGEIPPIQKAKTLKGLTPFVRDKIFKHDPNPAQLTAIEKALNTPDIFLIQGPPGTGKTTVITAILERLNEEQDKTSSIRGKILVSGFQHDAVENIISRLSINSLPAVKFGVRSGSTDDVVSNKISLWCQDVADKIRAKNPQIKESEAQRKLAELFTIYSISPSISNARGLLNLVIELPRTILSQELCNKTTQLIDTLNSNADIEQTDTSVLKLIRSLRISEEGFLDDGKDKASDVFTELEHQLQPDDKAVLKKAIIWKEGRDFDFLPALKSLKLKLLDLYSPRPQFRVEKPREDILALIAQVSKQLQAYQSRANKTDSILADFLHELEDNSNGVRESIEDYNFVFAATTQQAAGESIKLAKTKDKEEFVKYDTVIIDEAARVSPRDLLIPMAQAEKRIILVGDHRQLPHIIDEEVAKALDSGEDINQDFVKKSMFEYLFERLKKLEKADGVCRTVTLNAQYRTHPLLGNFVSDNFYKQYGESYSSPLPAELFNHDLKDAEGYTAVWLDIPNSKGKEYKNSSESRYRESEAKAIAKKLKEWIDSDAGKNLTFGVISFYKAQVEAVFEELKPFGITQKFSDEPWEISDDYKYIEKIEEGKKITEERLRIGTVDSFQGMEFDMVFLSMVRTQNMDKLPANIKNETNPKIKAGLLFGHLMSENRLCVSMSRQKKILVVVGDSELVQTEIGREYVPALGNYFDLCKEHGVIL
jgi:superfamily I DNA and/or RNA helicase